VKPANVGQALAALTESSVAREIIGRKNAKRYSGKQECDCKGGFGRSRIDSLIAIEERQGRRSARRLAEEFRFKDHGLGLEFTDKKRLAEFFEKTREFFPDTWLQADAILVIGERVITEWTLNATLTEPFYGGLKRKIKTSLHGASIVRTENGKITDWADYYDGLTSRRTALAAHFEEWVEL